MREADRAVVYVRIPTNLGPNQRRIRPHPLRQPTVTTIELFAIPLPPNPAPYEEWRSDRPDYLYDTVSNPELHADEQVM